MAENPTQYFPDVDVSWDVVSRLVFDTQIAQTIAKKEQRRTMSRTEGLREITLTTSSLAKEAAFDVRQFYRSMRGELISFYWWHPASYYFEDEDVGDASSGVPFSTSIPFREVENASATILGNAQTIVVSEGAQEATLDIASPTHSGPVLLTFEGRERLTVRFAAPLVETWLANTPEQRAVLQIAMREVY